MAQVHTQDALAGRVSAALMHGVLAMAHSDALQSGSHSKSLELAVDGGKLGRSWV